MRFRFRELHGLEDAQANFEQIEQQNLFTGAGVPAFLPDGKQTAFYFRTDTPTVANQRIYVWTGSSWAGIV